MGVIEIAAFVVGVALVVFLVYALLYPDRL